MRYTQVKAVFIGDQINCQTKVPKSSRSTNLNIEPQLGKYTHRFAAKIKYHTIVSIPDEGKFLSSWGNQN